MSVDGTGLRRLTIEGGSANPDWRPVRRREPKLALPRSPLPEPSVRVPDVTGLALGDARQAIEDAGLRAITRTVAGRLPLGRLRAQSPSGGARVPRHGCRPEGAVAGRRGDVFRLDDGSLGLRIVPFVNPIAWR